MCAWGGGSDLHAVLAAQKHRLPSTKKQMIGPGQFERAVHQALTQRYGREGHKLAVRVFYPQQPLDVGFGKIHLEVEDLKGGGRVGRRAFRVSLFVNKKFLKTVNVVCEVKASTHVAAPRRWMKPGDLIMREDLTFIPVSVPSLDHDFVLDPRRIIGKEVLRPLPPRKPIRKEGIQDPPVVKKGDRVTLEVRQGGLLVQTIGMAKASGKTGETIPVKNQQSGREVLGTIVGAGVVGVQY